MNRIAVHVTQADNDRYFDQKLPTWRNGFCKIERTVALKADPLGVHDEGEYGTIKVGVRELIVTEAGDGWDIQGWAS